MRGPLNREPLKVPRKLFVSSTDFGVRVASLLLLLRDFFRTRTAIYIYIYIYIYILPARKDPRTRYGTIAALRPVREVGVGKSLSLSLSLLLVFLLSLSLSCSLSPSLSPSLSFSLTLALSPALLLSPSPLFCFFGGPAQADSQFRGVSSPSRRGSPRISGLHTIVHI